MNLISQSWFFFPLFTLFQSALSVSGIFFLSFFGAQCDIVLNLDKLFLQVSSAQNIINHIFNVNNKWAAYSVAFPSSKNVAENPDLLFQVSDNIFYVRQFSIFRSMFYTGGKSSFVFLCFLIFCFPFKVVTFSVRPTTACIEIFNLLSSISCMIEK